MRINQNMLTHFGNGVNSLIADSVATVKPLTKNELVIPFHNVVTLCEIKNVN